MIMCSSSPRCSINDFLPPLIATMVQLTTKQRVVVVTQFTLTPKIRAVQNAFRFPLFPDRNTISLNSHVPSLV